ncbi:MAG: signal peptidase II [Clostridia bacterium]|nr:signal peptidase II [Clostridia bacterium]
MRKNLKIYWIVSFILLLCDQATKYWAETRLIQGAIDIWPGVLRFRYARNTGAAFSMFSGGNAWLAIFTAAMTILVLILYFREKNLTPLSRGGLALVAFGGAANLIDRVTRGYVVDFIEPVFVRFAVFNIADCMVSIGAALVVIGVIVGEVRKNAVDG